MELGLGTYGLVGMPGDPGLPGVPPLDIQNGDVPLASLEPAGEKPGPPGVIPASKPVKKKIIKD